jgi:hypothetical protein
MVPFSLRLAKAALPFLTEKDRSLDQMFELIDWINQRHAESLARSNNVSSGPPEIDPHSRLASTTEIDDAARAAMDAGQPISDSQTPCENTELVAVSLSLTFQFIALRWLQRLRRTRLLCATLLSRDGKPGLAAALLERELPSPQATVLDSDVLLYGALVQLYVSVGDLEEATRTTEAIERCCAGASGTSLAMRRAQMHNCQGLIAVGQGKFGDAVDCFHSALQAEPNNVVAANNRAVCMLYMCALPHALLALEQSLSSGHMNQVVIGNLCTLYDLASDKSSDKKKLLLGLVSKYASDDFITQELAPKLSAASGTTSVSKPTETPPTNSGGAAGGGATTATNAPAKRTNSISSPAAAISKSQKKSGATTKL